MSAPAVLIATARIRSGKEEDFNAWQAQHRAVAHRFPGFISSDLIPPTQPNSNEWTIVLNHRTGITPAAGTCCLGEKQPVLYRVRKPPSTAITRPIVKLDCKLIVTDLSSGSLFTSLQMDVARFRVWIPSVASEPERPQ
jgi:hypothetical protein